MSLRRQFVRARPVVLGLALGFIFACKGSDEAEESAEGGVEDLTIVVEADKSRILQEEQSLQEKRVGVEQETARLAKERADIEAKLASLSKKDKKQRDELEAQEKKLADEERRIRENTKNFESERAKLDEEKTKLLDRISKLTATKGGMTIEQREAALAQREKDVALREKAVADREGKIAAREGEVGKRLTELASAMQGMGGTVTKTIVVNNTSAASAPAGGATKASAQKVQKQVRGAMDAKGLLGDDLPPTAKELLGAGNEAMENKDYGSAQQSFTDLLGVIESIQINRAFIEGKMQRANKIAQKKQLNDEGKGLLDEISNSAADGRYDRANRKLNQLLALIK